MELKRSRLKSGYVVRFYNLFHLLVPRSPRKCVGPPTSQLVVGVVKKGTVNNYTHKGGSEIPASKEIKYKTDDRIPPWKAKLMLIIFVLVVAAAYTVILNNLHILNFYDTRRMGKSVKEDKSVKNDKSVKEDQRVKEDQNVKVDQSVKVDQNVKVDKSLKVDKAMHHVPLDVVYKEQLTLDDLSLEFEENKPSFMINTPGCKIPMILKQYDVSKNIDDATCGERAVFFKRHDSNYVQVAIEEKAIMKLMANHSEYRCCYYQFTSHKNITTQTLCQDVRDGDVLHLKHDFIGVKCYEIKEGEEEKIIYKDVYAFVKTKEYNERDRPNKFNVLIIGVNSMSLSRFSQTMPRTVNFFKDNNWLAFRGYHKIGDTNKIDNIMTAFIGHDAYVGTEKCSYVSELCLDLIWRKFEGAGYVTAFGEDYVDQPDSINKQYSFKEAPTNHYVHPLFKNIEQEVNDKKLVCTGKKTSAQQLLDYAYDFVLTYRQSPFFGFFFMNSFSKYVKNYREDADKMLEDFFNRLIYTGILKNTFVILVSDHGLQTQERPLTLGAFYDNQSPVFFMYLPEKFGQKFRKKPLTLNINQFRLITPFDLYDTLYDISEIANGKEYSPTQVQLRNHQSLLDEVSLMRTCEKIRIDFAWCSCNRLYSLEKLLPTDLEDVRSVQFFKNYFQGLILNIKTQSCMRCASLAIKNTTSLYYMVNRETGQVYHHISFNTTVEGMSYDATVLEKGSELLLIKAKPVQDLPKDFGNCTTEEEYRYFCICEKRPDCDDSDANLKTSSSTVFSHVGGTIKGRLLSVNLRID